MAPVAGHDLPSGLVAFVFTDVEGSTRLLRHLDEEYPAVLGRHFDVLRAAWDAHRGHEINTAGDGCFVAFAEPGAAIAACVEAQRALAAEVWPPDGEVRVRMGIHAGLASARGHEYVALAVHQAARVMSAAHGGQILVSAAAARGAAIPADVALLPLGRFRLRDFDVRPLVYAVSAPGMHANTRPRVRCRSTATTSSLPRPPFSGEATTCARWPHSSIPAAW
jgi:class 3 adenylate cyclase